MALDIIGAVHEIGEEIGGDIVLGDDYGANGDIVVNKNTGVIQQKQAGTWVVIWGDT